jgi:mRNA interferase RelE/StbE
MTPVEEKFILGVPDDIASVLKKLHPVIKSHIRFGLSRILGNPYCGKALKEKLQGLRSYKIKRYRIIYRINPEKQHIEIVAIGPRRIIYEETFRILSNE